MGYKVRGGNLERERAQEGKFAVLVLSFLYFLSLCLSLSLSLSELKDIEPGRRRRRRGVRKRIRVQGPRLRKSQNSGNSHVRKKATNFGHYSSSLCDSRSI